MESAKEVEQKAAEWLSLRDGGNWTAGDQALLDQWLEESTGHAVAYVRLEAAWHRADRLKALGAGVAAGKVPTSEEFNLFPIFTQDKEAAHSSQSLERGTPGFPGHRLCMLRAPRAFVAGLAAALIAAATWFYWPGSPQYKTPIGGTESVPMADGSRVTLNTDSVIRVVLTDYQREIRLDQGEAFFEVARDPARPFVVSVGNKRVVAVGTKFSVRRIGEEIRVFVTEGKVRLEEDAGSSLPARRETAEGRAEAMREGLNRGDAGELLLIAGGVAQTDGKGVLVQEESLAAVEESLSWRTGYIVFHEKALGEAVAEFNRYNSRKIVVEDSGVAAITFSGKFRTTDVEAFVRLIGGGFHLHVLQSGNRIWLTKTG